MAKITKPVHVTASRVGDNDISAQRCSRSETMKFEEIPDDVWISVFEQVKDPSVLAVLVRTCSRFHELASKPLLMELKWIKPESTVRNLEAWKGVYRRLVTLPRKVTIGVPFDHIKYPIFMLTPEMELHDCIHEGLLQFSSLTELVFDGTLISLYTYQILAAIPTLRTLRLLSCNVFGLQSSFRNKAFTGNHAQNLPLHPSPPPNNLTTQQPGPLAQFRTLSITHLSVHGCIIPTELETSAYHPLCLLTAPNLCSLSITWTANMSARYAQSRWSLPSLKELSVTLPLLSRDLLDELAGLVDRCSISLRVQLKIEKHNLSDTQMATIQVPSKGLWNYEGPLAIIASSVAKAKGSSALTHVKITEMLELPLLLDGLAKFPTRIEVLDIQVGRWDIEVLFAVKSLFREIQELIIKYIRGSFSPDLLVRMGADILFCLPKLRILKLLGPRPIDNSAARRSASVSTSADGSDSHHHGPLPIPLPPIDFPDSGDGDGHWAPQAPGTMVQFSQYDAIMDSEETSTYDIHAGENMSQLPPMNDEQFARGLAFEEYQAAPSTSTWNVSPFPPIVGTTASGSTPTSSSLSTPTASLLFSLSPAFNRPRPRILRSRTPFSRGEQAPQQQPTTTTRREGTSLTSSQAELGDYLIGWSRYCRSLRVVQIEHRWWWDRKFDGDRWALQRVVEDEEELMAEKGKRNKGKEREKSLFV